MIDELSVYQARINMSRKLADRILREMPNHDIDVVILFQILVEPVRLRLLKNLEFCSERFIKNRYIGRTFIVQTERQKSVRQKLNPVVQNSGIETSY